MEMSRRKLINGIGIKPNPLGIQIETNPYLPKDTFLLADDKNYYGQDSKTGEIKKIPKLDVTVRIPPPRFRLPDINPWQYRLHGLFSPDVFLHHYKPTIRNAHEPQDDADSSYPIPVRHR